MATSQLQPFKAKAEERAKAPAPDAPKSDPPAKRQCSAYDKQIQAMDGDVSLVKDSSGCQNGMRVTYVTLGPSHHAIYTTYMFTQAPIDTYMFKT